MRISTLVTVLACLWAAPAVNATASRPSHTSASVSPPTSETQGIVWQMKAVSDANLGQGRHEAWTPFRYRLDAETGLVEFVSGHFPTEARLARPDVVARAFLQEWAAAFGLENPLVNLVTVSSTVNGVGEGQARLRLEVGGVPVDGAEVLVISEGKMVRSVTSSLVQTRGLEVRPRLSHPEAASIALDDLSGLVRTLPTTHHPGRYDAVTVTGAALTWLPEGHGAPTLTWQLDLAGWRYHVDADRGAVLSRYDLRLEAAGR